LALGVIVILVLGEAQKKDDLAPLLCLAEKPAQQQGAKKRLTSQLRVLYLEHVGTI